MNAVGIIDDIVEPEEPAGHPVIVQPIRRNALVRVVAIDKDELEWRALIRPSNRLWRLAVGNQHFSVVTTFTKHPYRLDEVLAGVAPLVNPDINRADVSTRLADPSHLGKHAAGTGADLEDGFAPLDLLKEPFHLDGVLFDF